MTIHLEMFHSWQPLCGHFESGNYASGDIAILTHCVQDFKFSPPYTGVIYTHPSYADQIANFSLLGSNFNELTGMFTLDEILPPHTSPGYTRNDPLHCFSMHSLQNNQTLLMFLLLCMTREILLKQ